MAVRKEISGDKLLARAEKYSHDEVSQHGGPIWLVEECDLLKRALNDKVSDYGMQRSLQVLGRLVMVRCSYGLAVGKTSNADALRDGWKLQTLAAYFFERSALSAMSGCRTLEEVNEKKSLDAVHYWKLAQVVWGQLATGLDGDGKKGLELLALCEMRGQDDLPDHYAGLPRELNQLLRAANPGPTEFKSFAKAPPLEKLGEVWNDDRAFQKMLFDACDWHLKKIYPADSYLAGIILFPAWLFALDRYRQQRTGKSCLPDHPLMVYGKRILAADFSGPAHPLVTQAEAEYARRYADKPVDFGGHWRTFLGHGNRKQS